MSRRRWQPDDARAIGLLGLLLVLLLVALSGCAPYVGYSHTSSPHLADDGRDLVCAGIELERGAWFASAGACENVAPDGGAFAQFDVRYRWRQ